MEKRKIALPHGTRPGSLILVGSGIKSISQFTLESVAHIESADIVFYCVADPATERFIESKNKNSHDMNVFYDDGKLRHETYAQMAEAMLREVRKGRYVVGVFYGHPGVFVNPSHRALAIALHEGYEARMLPGISAEDNLFADLGVDPSRPGCQTVEATDLLLLELPLLTDSHVIIFQVGCVGDVGFNFKGFTDQKFNVLVDRLIKDYGDDHELIHYVAAQYPTAMPIKEHYKIKDLYNPSVASRITGISTFYLPPKVLRQGSDLVANKLGLRLLGKPSYTGPYAPATPYGKLELKAVADLDQHETPKNYKKTRTSQAMYDALHDLSVKPNLLHIFNHSPDAFVSSRLGLRYTERKALISRHPGYIRMVMKKTPQEVATEFVQYEIRNPSIAQQYVTILKENKNKQDGKANIETWLKQQGYEITLEDIYQAYLSLQEQAAEAAEAAEVELV